MRRIRPPDVLKGALDRLDGSPWVCDCRSIDIPNTIRALLRNAPAGLVAISLRPYGAEMIAAAARAARKHSIRIIWPPAGRAMRGDPE